MNDEGVMNLMVEVLREGVKKPDFYREPCGIEWCERSGLDPQAMWRLAIKGTPREGEPYSEIGFCMKIL